MSLTYIVHIGAGTIGLLSGYTALAVIKGADWHRKVGMVFVVSMLVMALMGAFIAATKPVAATLNVPAGLMTAYLVMTSLATVRPALAANRALTIALMIPASGVGIAVTTIGIRAVVAGRLSAPFFMFAFFALLGVAGDIGVLRHGAPTGARRLSRHLWRMCLALFIAAMSFFIGQAKVIPEPLRIMPLLAMPVLLVLIMMGYWMWRVRIRQSLRGLKLRQAPGTVPAGAPNASHGSARRGAQILSGG
jgi:hypothetical protein